MREDIACLDLLAVLDGNRPEEGFEGVVGIGGMPCAQPRKGAEVFVGCESCHVNDM